MENAKNDYKSGTIVFTGETALQGFERDFGRSGAYMGFLNTVTLTEVWPPRC
jgi:hypothetical protein